MKLKDLLAALNKYAVRHDGEVDISNICYDSRKTGKGALFVAMKGEKSDGNLYVSQAVSKGAVALVTETDTVYEGAVTVRVPNAREALALLSAAFYRHPARGLKLVGITGTNGKTTTSYLIESILRESGLNPGLIGTISYRYGDKVLPAPNTTPESLDLQMLMRRMADEGVGSVVMEVSSHALVQDRVAGLNFDAAVFTNMTQDHLDYHLTMEDYFEAKSRLFTRFIDKRSSAVINLDDPKGELLAGRAAGNVIGYGIRNKTGIHTEDISMSVDGIHGYAVTPAGRIRIDSTLMGEFNLYNILAAVGAGVGLGIVPDSIEKGISSLSNVPGRMERVDAGQPFTTLVDYAHTPDALERVLMTVKTLAPRKIITVFGCGGDRDRGKRPIMGRVAVRYSDLVIVTSDNPRTEDPLTIIGDIKAGIEQEAKGLEPSRCLIIPDRREAIRAAVNNAGAGDVVLIAGKGHEDYQIIGTEKIHFDDREEVIKAVQEA